MNYFTRYNLLVFFLIFDKFNLFGWGMKRSIKLVCFFILDEKKDGNKTKKYFEGITGKSMQGRLLL